LGHCNIRGNEEADKAAQNAISNPNSLALSLMSPVDIIGNVDKILYAIIGLRLASSYPKTN